MAGIYIHIPFCKKRCSYCDFYKETNFNHASQLVDAICDELELRKRLWTGEIINTVYFGGGTPSSIEVHHIGRILERIGKELVLHPDAEITLEANPDDLNENYLRKLHTLPVNRLSMGVQSFDDSELKMLNRRHDGQQAKMAVEIIKTMGFTNFSVDLIFGLPNQNMETWKNNVNTAISLEPAHLSCYSLTYEEGTSLHRWKQTGKVVPVSDETSLEMYKFLIHRMSEAGFEHYEISNFATPGMRSKHNCSYWSGAKYLGLGPSAHSYNGIERFWNISDNQSYIKALQNGESFSSKEILDEMTRYNEYVMTSLRKKEGADLKELKKQFGDVYYDYFLKLAACHIERGDLIRDMNRIHLSKNGIFTSDGIMADLLRTE